MDTYNYDKKADPDYSSNHIAVKRAEKLKEDSVDPVQKFKEIITEEFNKDLSNRQNQIEDIEQQIYKTQKLLHLLKYVLISSYYNRKELEYNGSEDSVLKADTPYLFDQNRIHPALKKLLGKNSSAPDFAMCRSARRNKAGHKSNLLVENLNDTSIKDSGPISNKYVSSHSTDGSSTNNSGIARNRQKINKKIIVGNISKWMNSYEEDNLTHKWMMYVRGPKENPDVSHFIDKVVFHLHPSYKPHDVVEVSESPFHLSRRGWGEFPIKVQIHFKCTLNKPVYILHNLKLDKTYSGRQTLGKETIIDLYLYDDKISGIMQDDEEVNLTENPTKIQKNEDMKKHEIIAFSDICEKVESEDGLFTQIKEETVSNFEHDYCSENVKPNINHDDKHHIEPLNPDHTYSYPPSHQYLNIDGLEKIKPDTQEHIKQEECSLIYGLDESYTATNEELSKKEPLYYKKAIVYTKKNQQEKAPQNQSKSSTVKRKSQESLLKKMFNSKIASQLSTIPNASSNIDGHQSCSNENAQNIVTADQFQISLNQRKDLNLPRFKNMGEALSYLFKRIPLVNELTESSKFKYSYPFTTSSMKEYLSWNSAKQSSAEWTRAKVIKNILEKEDIYEQQKWTTRALMLYGRSHGYTPKSKISILKKNSVEVRLINFCFKVSIDLPLNPHKFTVEVPVDVVNESDTLESKRLKLSTIDVSDPKLKTHCAYVREEALECGVVLKNEAIDENIVFNGGERMILEAVKCLADHLVRRSLHYAISDGSYKDDTAEISVAHVQKAKLDRKEFAALAEFKMKQTKLKYLYH
ncbi:hypothetical protein WA026_005804 [Henosepilachna vigintioctopunctata]|uniref:YEATS domain-containing protein n=1 Tax=Henosepilachna vigintioctopunctata TaxID=420089 RepID=A0AAW1U2U6_9CUCU